MYRLMDDQASGIGHIVRIATVLVMAPTLLAAPLGSATILLHDHHDHGFHGHVTKGAVNPVQGLPVVPGSDGHDHDYDGLVDETTGKETAFVVIIPDLTTVATATSIVSKVTVPTCGSHDFPESLASATALQTLNSPPRISPSFDIPTASSGASDVLQRNHALLL